MECPHLHFSTTASLLLPKSMPSIIPSKGMSPLWHCAHPRRFNILCMAAPPYLIAKLDSAEKTWKGLSVKLADPDIVSNPSEFQKLAQSMAELDEVVSAYTKYKDCEKQIEEAKALAKEEGSDPDMADMIAYEIETLSKQLVELEEELKVMLLPTDPLDSRNILLEVRAGTGGDEAGIWAGDLQEEEGSCTFCGLNLACKPSLLLGCSSERRSFSSSRLPEQGSLRVVGQQL